MMSDPLTRSTNTGHMYEYGEYDGLVDLEAILHGAVTNPSAAASPTATRNATGNSGAAGGAVPNCSPTPHLSCLAGSESNNDSANSTAAQHHNHSTANGEQSSTLSPHIRSIARKQLRETTAGHGNVFGPDRYPGMHGSNNSIPRSNGGYPMMEDSEVSTSTTTTHSSAPAAAPSPRSGPYKRGESAKGSRSNNSSSNNNTSATLSNNNNNNNSNNTDNGVHLPVILPSQQRRPTDTLMQPRVRVSSLMQETTTAAAATAANAATGTSAPHNARSATSVSPLLQHSNNNNSNTPRPGGAKTVMSANNLAALQRNSNERAHTGPMSTGTSSNKVPPYLAPPLSPLHTRQNPPHPSVAPAVTGAITGPSAPTNNAAGGPAAAAFTRPVTNGAAKRGESTDSAAVSQQRQQQQQSAAHSNKMVDITNPSLRSNGWVKEEPRRVDRTSQQVATGFPQERLQKSDTQNNAASTEDVRGHAEGGAARGKANTSPAPAASRAPVWSNDYEMGPTNSVGCTASADFGTMPKVAAPPLPQQAKKTLSDSAGRRTALFRPPPHVPSTPPVGKTTSPVESTLSPLRIVAQQQQPTNKTTNANTAFATTPLGAVVSNTTKQTALADTAAGTQTRVASANLADCRVHSSSPHPPLPPTLSASHRRVMNAVDTYSNSASGDAAASGDADLKAAVVATANGTTIPAAQAAASAATRPNLPYSDDCRAALEAWVAFPALDVTMRGQVPTAVQLHRERDFAASRPLVVQQLYQPVKGQAPQEFAGEPFEMNYDVHNVVVQLRHRNRPLQLAYPPQLPVEPDMRPRLRRQRTPRSFYGKRLPHVGDAWFRNALDDARQINSPDIESMEKREEEEFVRNGGDPAQRRNRYGQANNHNNNNKEQEQQRAAPHHDTGAPNIEQINRNAVRMEQPAV